MFRPGRLALAAAVAAAAAAILASPDARRVAYLIGALLGRKLPFLRPVLPALAGDGREEAAAAWVRAHAPPGNVTAAIAAFEAFASSRSWMMAVGPVKGKIVADALAASGPRGRRGPSKILELGTYCGYGAMLLASASGPHARVYSVEVVPRFAAVARSVLQHAGLEGRVTVLEGRLGGHLAALGAADPPGPLDFVFVDHAKEAYLPDVQALLRESALVRSSPDDGTVFAADNLRVPGAPAYVAWLKSRPPAALDTAWHDTELEFTNGLVPDLVAVSRVVDAGRAVEG